MGLSPGMLALAGLLALVILIGLRRLFAGAMEPATKASSDGALSKIERIKQYREQHGVGLKEAKDAVEAEFAGQPVRPAPRASSGPSENLEELLRTGHTLEAIKLYRTVHDVGLKEAKEAIDALREQKGRNSRG